MLHVYGIIDNIHMAGAAPRGHEGDAVTTFPVGAIAAVVSRATRSSIDVSRDRVWRHETVLGVLMERHSVLPMRFGTVCTDEELSRLLEHRRDALCAALHKLASKVEMAVRIADDTLREPASISGPLVDRPSASTGKAYLLARLARHKEDSVASLTAGGQLETVRAYLEARSLDMAWHVPDAFGTPIKVSCLIHRKEVEGFAAGLERLIRPGFSLSCTGPWAPYSFVGKGARLGGGA